MGIISIQDLKVRCIVGVNPHERKIEQDLFVDLRIEIDFSAAAVSDHLSHTVDYTEMADLLTGWMRREKFLLIETLAERACTLLCAGQGARYAAVTAEKDARATKATAPGAGGRKRGRR